MGRQTRTDLGDKDVLAALKVPTLLSWAIGLEARMSVGPKRQDGMRVAHRLGKASVPSSSSNLCGGETDKGGEEDSGFSELHDGMDGETWKGLGAPFYTARLSGVESSGWLFAVIMATTPDPKW